MRCRTKKNLLVIATTTTAARTILALDVGDFKSVACVQDRGHDFPPLLGCHRLATWR
jgi:hypothetical protein